MSPFRFRPYADFTGNVGRRQQRRYVAGLLKRLGIDDQIKPKIRSGGPGESAKLISRGEVDFERSELSLSSAPRTSSGSATSRSKFKAGSCSAGASTPKPKNLRQDALC